MEQDNKEEKEIAYTDLQTLEEKVNWFLQINTKDLEREKELGTAGRLSRFSNTVVQLQNYLIQLDAAKIEASEIRPVIDLDFPIKIQSRDLRNRSPSLLGADWQIPITVNVWLDAAQRIIRVAKGNSAEKARQPNFEEEICEALDLIVGLFRRLISLCRDWITKSQDNREIPKSIIENLLESATEPTIVNAKRIESLASEMEETSQKAHVSQERLNAILTAATADASKRGIADEAIHFSTEAKAHQRTASKWLIATISGAATIILIAAYFYFSDQPGSTAELKMIDWNNFIPKLSALAILIFLEFALIANYRAERHNAIVNKHRANALSTFETMTQSTTTQDVRDAVTLTAANAIYAPQETGFGKRANTSSMSAADILGNMVSRDSD